eukprot:gene19135-27103_t
MHVTSTHPLPDFLAEPRKRLFIDGQWIAPLDDEYIPTVNPATGEVLAQLARGRAADVDVAVVSARRAFEGPWSRFTPAQRQQVIMRFAELFEQHFDELSMLESLDMGAPLHGRLRPAKGGVVQTILYYASQARVIHGETVPNSLPG